LVPWPDLGKLQKLRDVGSGHPDKCKPTRHTPPFTETFTEQKRPTPLKLGRRGETLTNGY